MKKHSLITILFTMLVSMSGIKAFAQDIEIRNEDDVTIYYDYINDGLELEVVGSSATKNLIIPEEVTYEGRTLKVTSIGKGAFFYENLISVTIPKSILICKETAFGWCRSLTSVHISDLTAWCNIDFEGSYSNPLYYAHHLYLNGEEIIDLVIPKSVTHIANLAFINCNISSVTFHDKLVSIGKRAFDYSNLTSVNIPHSVTSIGEGAFEYCNNLTSAIFSNSLNNIERGMFSHCSNLSSFVIPESVTNIGDYAFEDCISLTSINIPKGVTSIGECVFSGCGNIKVYCYPEEVPSLGNYTFTKNMTIYVSEDALQVYQSTSPWDQLRFSIKEGNIIELGGLYFYPYAISPIVEVTSSPDCYSGKSSIDIPRKISYNDKEYIVKYIGDDAFSGCSTLTSLSIPNSVKSIGQHAFYDCTNLKSIIIPSSVTSIGSGAFQGCSSLASLSLSNSLSRVDDNLFYDCRSLLTMVIPESVTYIGSNAFHNCSYLTTIALSPNVTYIGSGAFYGCKNLVSITIPPGVESIYGSTFCDCNSLASVTIPNNVRSIGVDAFRSCDLTTLELPNSLESIGSGAFNYCYNLTSVSFSNKIMTVGDNAFRNCNSLSSVHITNLSAWCQSKFGSGSSNPLVLAHHLFLNGEEVKELSIPEDVTYIGDGTFWGCKELTSLDIPSSVTDIGNFAFGNCSGLSSIKIPKSVKSIGDNAFQDCDGLISLDIDDGLEIIGASSFGWCNILSVNLPNTLKIIKESAFMGCPLKSITIPASVEYIYQSAFAYCTTLVKIEAHPTTPPFLYDNSFSDYTIPLQVPKGCREKYQTAQGWKNFTNIVDANLYQLIYTVNSEVYMSYVIREGDIIIPEETPTKEGYYFSGWSEIPETMPAHDVTVTGRFVLTGDANGNDIVDEADIEEVVNYIMGHPSEIINMVAADANHDGKLNVADIVEINNIIKK